MRRWLERLAAGVMVLVIIALLLACWVPAYIGGTPPVRPGHRGPPERPGRR